MSMRSVESTDSPCQRNNIMIHLCFILNFDIMRKWINEVIFMPDNLFLLC